MHSLVSPERNRFWTMYNGVSRAHEALPHFIASDPAAGIAEPKVTRDFVNKLRLSFG